MFLDAGCDVARMPSEEELRAHSRGKLARSACGLRRRPSLPTTPRELSAAKLLANAIGERCAVVVPAEHVVDV
eukprot:3404419-Prymnesium_polylepis.1